MANSRYRKIRAVIKAANLTVEDVPHETNTNLSKLSVFKTLPILETPEGNIFSSNSIVRYLATVGGNKLYGGENLHHRALVDQWLDVSACEFDAAVSAIAVAKDGKEVDVAALSQDIHKFLGVIEQTLNGKKFFVGDQLSIADIALAANLSIVFSNFLGEAERAKLPNTTAWYLNIVGIDSNIGNKDLPKEAHKAFAPKKDKKEEPKKQEAKKEEGDDLFDDDSTPAPVAAKPVAQPAKPAKKKAVAKSIVVFDVKVYEQEEDLLALFKKIKEIELDGLVWNNEPKILPVAFGMNKLQVGCVIEDAKVQLDDIYEKIEAWEDTVQSVDTASMQKL